MNDSIKDTPACGDTVRLKSGGPLMTVARIDNNTAHCCWFGEHLGPVQSAPFHVLALVKSQYHK